MVKSPMNRYVEHTPILIHKEYGEGNTLEGRKA